jgi:hypothetical protein
VKRSIGRRQLLGGAAALAGELHPAILDRAVERSSLGGLFEQRISTDRNKTFKPDPRAYQLAADAFRLDREQILFVASAGWDVAGARRCYAANSRSGSSFAIASRRSFTVRMRDSSSSGMRMESFSSK